MIKLENISKQYDKILFEYLNLEFGNSGLYTIIGENGSGKSTLLKILSNQELPDSGNVYLNNELIAGHERYCSNILQETSLFESLTVYENLFICNDKDDLDEVLFKLKIYDLKNKRVDLLSTGERQRVAIARAILSDSDILLADEITSNLDFETEIEIFEILKDISKTKLVILVTHNLSLALKYSDYVYELKNQTLNLIIENDNLVEITDTDNIIVKKENIKFSIILKLLINDIKKSKFISIISTVILSLLFIIQIILLSIICSNENKPYNKLLHNNNDTYSELLTENLNPLSNKESSVLNEIFEYGNDYYKYIDAVETIGPNDLKITKLIIDNSLNSNEIVLPKCLYNKFNNIEMNDSLIINDYDFVYKGVYNDESKITDNNHIYISNDFFVDLYTDVDLTFVISINSIPYSSFKFLIDERLNSNEVVIPNSIKIDNDNFILSLRHLNINLNLEKKYETNESQTIYISRELYDDLCLYNANGGYVIDTKLVTYKDVKILKDNDIYIYSSYINNYISISRLKVDYWYLIIIPIIIISLLIFLFVDIFIKNKIKTTAKNSALFLQLGLNKSNKFYFIINIGMIVFFPLVFSIIFLILISIFFRKLVYKMVFPYYNFVFMVPIVILIVMIILIYFIGLYSYKKIK